MHFRNGLIGTTTAALFVSAAAAFGSPWDLTPLSTEGQEERPVYCLDVGRKLIARKPAADCLGKVVSEKEARAVRNQRIQRQRSSLRSRLPLIPGRRVVGLGTGFFISEDGHVLTNWHVINECAAVSVEPFGRDAKVGSLLAQNRHVDLAVVQVDLPPEGIARFRSGTEVAIGEPVSIVGYPLHGRSAIKPIHRVGRVIEPELGRRPLDPRYQVRIDVRRGNSGGPVLDSRGRVVGVISAKVNTPSAFRHTGRVIRDVGVVIDPGTIYGFLRRNRVPYDRVKDAADKTDREVLTQAQGYIARIACWR